MPLCRAGLPARWRASPSTRFAGRLTFAVGGIWRPGAGMTANAPTRLHEEARSGQLGLGAIADDGRWVVAPGQAPHDSTPGLGRSGMTRGAVQARGGRAVGRATPSGARLR